MCNQLVLIYLYIGVIEFDHVVGRVDSVHVIAANRMIFIVSNNCKLSVFLIDTQKLHLEPAGKSSIIRAVKAQFQMSN